MREGRGDKRGSGEGRGRGWEGRGVWEGRGMEKKEIGRRVIGNKGRRGKVRGILGG